MARYRKSKSSRRNSGLSLGGIILIAAIILVGIGAYRIYANQKGETAPQSAGNVHSTGDLTYVVTNPAVKQYPVEYTGMSVNFNPELHIPNWAAWELTDRETRGGVQREQKFYCDESVPGCAETWDYSYSGYDRGHIVPAGDMKWSADAMHSTFSLVNICPQVHSLNAGAWKKLEEKCRKWAQIDGNIIIISGPVLNPAPTEFIGDTRVAVPKSFFKVILSPNANPVRGIGFIMPNGKVAGGMQAAACSIDRVEELTGHNFFSALPDDVEKEVEQQCDFHFWSTHKKL